MLALLAATLIWSFSFGIIKQVLVGVPGEWVATLRLALAALVFLPFLRRAPLAGARLRLLAIGGVQFGLMYLLYLQSYQALDAWEVALFTAFTPIWVLLLEALLPGRRRSIPRRAWVALLGAVAGAWLIRADPAARPDFGEGFLWIQAANLCFAFGQVAYRRTLQQGGGRVDAAAHAWMFLGGTAVAGLVMAVRLVGGVLTSPAQTADELALSLEQLAAIAYLGVVAAGLGFFLWNAGARRVSAGLLAAANNLKVPAGMAVSVLLFGEALAPDGELASWVRKLGGSALVLAAVVIASRDSRTPRST